MIVYPNFIWRTSLGGAFLTAILTGFLTLFSTMVFAESEKAETVCLQPLGAHDKKALRASKDGITYLYGLNAKILPAVKLPKMAWYQPRKRWRAEKLLDFLNQKFGDDRTCSVVIGFTKRDISTTKDEHKDWGILGLGEVGGRMAVVSTFRMRKRLKKPNSLIRRAIKVTNHELGHVLGLPHVKGEGCLMNDAEGTVSTVDAESGLLCDSTIEYIEKRHGWKIPRHASFDWSSFEKP